MSVEQIITKTITTPAYPDPTEAWRYLDDPDGFYGYDYVYLEDATWNALCEIARERGRTVDELCGDIELNFAPGEDFAPAAPVRAALYRTGARQHRIAGQLPRSHGSARTPESPMTKAAIAKPAPAATEFAGGGTAQQTTPQAPDAGEGFDQKLAAFKQRMQAHTDAIKRHLAHFIERTTSRADHTSVTAALLDLGFERQIDLHGEEDAHDLIERAFCRVVQRRRGPLQ